MQTKVTVKPKVFISQPKMEMKRGEMVGILKHVKVNGFTGVEERIYINKVDPFRKSLMSLGSCGNFKCAICRFNIVITRHFIRSNI